MRSAVSVNFKATAMPRRSAGAGSTEAAMEERRKAQRTCALKAGTIIFNRASGIDCRVSNMSPAGACLEVASQIGIPDDSCWSPSYRPNEGALPSDLAFATRFGVAFNG